jgi:uncharacterized membrane protein
MDDGFLVLLGFAGIAAFLLGPIGFFLTLGARARLKIAEGRIAELSRLTGNGDALDRPFRGILADSEPLASPTQTNLEEPPLAREPIPPTFEPAQSPVAAPYPASETMGAAEPPLAEEPPLSPVPAKPEIGLEERLGAHWAVIVGGVALAFGALLLVKYSIEQGFFGPGLRVIGGLLLGLGLVAAGEYMRRRDRLAAASTQVTPIPPVLTGAGTVAAFGSLYAAHALYGFIGPGLAFCSMGAVGVAAMFAAALHGPALAGLGLVGALGAPLLVTSNEPNPWPVVLFVAIVCAAAYGLARLRRWLWLAIAAGVGAAIWEGLFLAGLHGVNGIDFTLAAFVHLALETALAIVAFAFAPYLTTPQAEQRTDVVASAAMLGAGALGCIALAATALEAGAGPGWIVTAALIPAMLALTGVRLPAVASAAAASGAVILTTLTVWGAQSGWMVDPYAFFAQWPTPEDERIFVAFGLVASLALGLLTFWRLLTPTPLSFVKSAIYAGAGVLTPLGALSILYLRLTHFQISAGLAATAAGVAAAMAVGAAIFHQRREVDSSPAIALGLGALAAGAIAALALGLVFELSEGTLTVALALAALGSALVSVRLDIPALRWCVVALGLAVVGRLDYEPRIVGDALGKTILFNWLLFGYGVPALAFGLAARWMRPSGEDAPVRVAQAMSILCSALLAVFEIRHALNGGDPFAPASGMIEQGLFAVVGILFSLVLMELDGRRADPLYRFASLGFGGLALAQTLAGLLFWQNPFFSDAPVEGGAVFNGLILGYGLPAIAALILARRARHRPPEWRRIAAASTAIVLLFAYLNLELRRLFQGDPQIGFSIGIGNGEFYAYSALWLGLGIVLLAYGILFGSKPARLASAALVLLTVVKVFLLDLAGLEGVLRALSFLGLGATLIGIGIVYQKFVFARRPGEAAKMAASPEEI